MHEEIFAKGDKLQEQTLLHEEQGKQKAYKKTKNNLNLKQKDKKKSDLVLQMMLIFQLKRTKILNKNGETVMLLIGLDLVF